ncbi:MAG: SDR family oxidoreductase [Candidatus Melainabacteria bacterium]|nr:SDR family oxidoreductase [Candidatus Melainabacteria bacterium]
MTPPDISMRGRVCLITGATAGIGKVTALELATKGATVILVGRNEDRCRDALDEIHELTGSNNLDYFVCDLSNFQQVRSLSQAVKSKYSKLNVLVNNAGALFMRRQYNVDGLEMTWALNHFGYFWLTGMLLDVLKASAPSRVVVVSSDAHKRANLNEMPNFKANIPVGYFGYANTKLANLLFAYHLAYSIKSTGVTVNAMHPGVVATSFGGNNGLVGRIIQMNANIFGVKPEVGARTVIQLASAPELYATTGKYFVKEEEANSSKASHDTRLGTRLFQWSLDISQRLGMDTRQLEAR